MHQQRDYAFLKIDALEWWKVKKIRLIYRGPKKLSSFEKVVKPASTEPNFNAAKSHSEKVYKTKVVALKI